MYYKVLSSLLFLLLLSACDPNHRAEFDRIARSDIQGYEEFIRKYPKSSLVPDARERITVALNEKRQREEAARKEELRRQQEERERELQRQFENRYGNNSLNNGAESYAPWYGSNAYYDNRTPHSEIVVKAPSDSDVIVIVRYNNANGSVAGHVYIKAGYSAKIYLKNGYNYQTFFYYGKGWYPEKQMKGVQGGFIKNEAFSKDDTPRYMSNNILTYELTLQQYGNFRTSASSEGEIF